MRKFLGVFSALGASALAFAGIAAASVSVPAVPVSGYGDQLLTSLGTSIAAVLPYAAGITAFAIGVGMLRRWLGHRKATSI